MDTTLKDSQGVKEKQTASQEVNPTTTTDADAEFFIDFEATEASQEKEKPLKSTPGRKKIEKIEVDKNSQSKISLDTYQFVQKL